MKQLYRVNHAKSGKSRELEANDARHAIEMSGWRAVDVQVEVKVAGEWRKVKT